MWKGPDRKYYYVFGQIRTWYADLYWKINEKDHKDHEGNFLPVGYDLAQQFPLM